jgi:hypothetical protein
MRTFHMIGAAFMMAWALPATTYADGMPAANSVSAPGCHCPGVAQRHAWRGHGHPYAWHRRHGAVLTAVAAPWPAYNPPIPSAYDSAYDRVMTQYTRARELRGEYLIEPPYVPQPPLPGLPHFRVAGGGTVFEYDIMADGYVQLAQRDAQRALASVAPTP